MVVAPRTMSLALMKSRKVQANETGGGKGRNYDFLVVWVMNGRDDELSNYIRGHGVPKEEVFLL